MLGTRAAAVSPKAGAVWPKPAAALAESAKAGRNLHPGPAAPGRWPGQGLFTLREGSRDSTSRSSSRRPAPLEPDPPGLSWQGPSVKRHIRHATAQFVTGGRLVGRSQRLEKTGRFVREDGRWTCLVGKIAPGAET